MNDQREIIESLLENHNPNQGPPGDSQTSSTYGGQQLRKFFDFNSKPKIFAYPIRQAASKQQDHTIIQVEGIMSRTKVDNQGGGQAPLLNEISMKQKFQNHFRDFNTPRYFEGAGMKQEDPTIDITQNNLDAALQNLATENQECLYAGTKKYISFFTDNDTSPRPQPAASVDQSIASIVKSPPKKKKNMFEYEYMLSQSPIANDETLFDGSWQLPEYLESPQQPEQQSTKNIDPEREAAILNLEIQILHCEEVISKQERLPKRKSVELIEDGQPRNSKSSIIMTILSQTPSTTKKLKLSESDQGDVIVLAASPFQTSDLAVFSTDCQPPLVYDSSQVIVDPSTLNEEDRKLYDLCMRIKMRTPLLTPVRTVYKNSCPHAQGEAQSGLDLQQK